MRITVIGSGYVGLVVGACLADVGNEVTCADVDARKVAQLNDGQVPFYEPGLEPLVQANLAAGRLRFTTDLPAAVKQSQVIFIAVGAYQPQRQPTPSPKQGAMSAAGAGFAPPEEAWPSPGR